MPRAETVLHSFAFHSGEDTTHPQAGEIAVKGKLYGTGLAAAFSVDATTGKQTVIWPYCGGCAFPSGLKDLDGKLYGALQGGAGVVFVIEKAR